MVSHEVFRSLDHRNTDDDNCEDGVTNHCISGLAKTN
jgi:hypothetical protein